MKQCIVCGTTDNLKVHKRTTRTHSILNICVKHWNDKQVNTYNKKEKPNSSGLISRAW